VRHLYTGFLILRSSKTNHPGAYIESKSLLESSRVCCRKRKILKNEKEIHFALRVF
jgi:hypothetical protein